MYAYSSAMKINLSRGFALVALTSIFAPLAQANPVQAEKIAHKAVNKNLHSRAGNYEAYAPIKTVSEKNQVWNYSAFENPTGICFAAGDEAIIKVKDTHGQNIKLIVHDFGNAEGAHFEASLVTGENKISIPNKGNAYIQYFTDDYKKAKPITIDIQGGKVNGVFDISKHDNKDWKALLDNAQSDIMDIKGKRVQLAYTVNALKRNCPENGVELTNLYDQIIGHQQQILGWHKYDLIPKNHMFGRTIWDGFMHADGMGAAFHENTMDGITNVENLRKEAWGVAHEFGHVNQLTPGMTWVGLTEVSNNIFSTTSNYLLNPSNMRLEHERCPSIGGNVIGGRFNSYLQSALIEGEQWLCQKGPDKQEGYEDGGDHFVKLCPLWQLQLYFRFAEKGNKDFYPDLAQKARASSKEQLSNGERQIRFMKDACDVAKQNLSNFFVRAGMLKPIDKNIDDYTRAQLTITQKQCDDLIAYAKKYPAPTSPVLFYISANSIDAYKNKLPVIGKENQGITEQGDSRKVSHDVWRNAVAYETYADQKLIRAVIAGTDSPDNSSTLVPYPAEATCIKAVSWDGKRKIVTQK